MQNCLWVRFYLLAILLYSSVWNYLEQAANENVLMAEEAGDAFHDHQTIDVLRNELIRHSSLISELT